MWLAHDGFFPGDDQPPVGRWWWECSGWRMVAHKMWLAFWCLALCDSQVVFCSLLLALVDWHVVVSPFGLMGGKTQRGSNVIFAILCQCLKLARGTNLIWALSFGGFHAQIPCRAMAHWCFGHTRNFECWLAMLGLGKQMVKKCWFCPGLRLNDHFQSDSESFKLHKHSANLRLLCWDFPLLIDPGLVNFAPCFVCHKHNTLLQCCNAQMQGNGFLMHAPEHLVCDTVAPHDTPMSFHIFWVMFSAVSLSMPRHNNDQDDASKIMRCGN